MGLFSKKSLAPAVTLAAAQTPFDRKWFVAWWKDITMEAVVDPADERGQAELIWFTLHCLEDTARRTFQQMNQPDAWESFQARVSADRTPEMMAALLVGWNADMLDVLVQRLEKFRALMIEGGRMHGQFRFGMYGLE